MSAAVVARVRSLMQAQDLSQKDLAEQAGVDQTYVSRMFRAPTRISVETLVRLATALGVEPADLLPSSPQPRVDPQKAALKQIGADLAHTMEALADLSQRVGRVIAAHEPAKKTRTPRKR